MSVLKCQYKSLWHLKDGQCNLNIAPECHKHALKHDRGSLEPHQEPVSYAGLGRPAQGVKRAAGGHYRGREQMFVGRLRGRLGQGSWG